MTYRSDERRGFALMTAVVALAVLSITTTVLVRDLVAQRRQLERRHWQLQSLALARAGIERAAARLLATDSYAGEVLELLPQSTLTISVEREPGSKEVFRISSTSRFPTDVTAPVANTLLQRVRRVTEGTVVRLEFLPAAPSLPEKSD